MTTIWITRLYSKPFFTKLEIHIQYSCLSAVKISIVMLIALFSVVCDYDCDCDYDDSITLYILNIAESV